MEITKFGHCCLLIVENGVSVLTDPGNYTETQNIIKNIDVLLITHEHTDHYHVPSVKKIVENNPNVVIVTNSAVNKLLTKEGIMESQVVEDGQSFEVRGMKFLGFGNTHALIHDEWPKVQNTGYFIGKRLFYPGDSYYEPDIPVDILAMPIAGPWCKISEAVDYVLNVKPNFAFPVHDAGLKQLGSSGKVASEILKKHGIVFLVLEIDKKTEL